MSKIPTPAQRRASVVRWALVLAPLVLALGMASAWLSGSGEGDAWFRGLVKPALYPPPVLFPIVWTVLYLLMGVALALVVVAKTSAWKPVAIAAFVLQLALNLAWSPVFFGAHAITPALLVLLAMDVAVICTMALFAKLHAAAPWLLAPYLAWTLFATGLNWQLLVDNGAVP